jgi:hypothetical protein
MIRPPIRRLGKGEGGTSHPQRRQSIIRRRCSTVEADEGAWLGKINGRWAPPAAPAMRLASSVAAWGTTPGRSSGSSAAGDVAAATRAAVVKEVADVAVAKEAAEEAVKKKAIKEAVVRKMTTEEVAGKKKVIKESAGKKVVDEMVAKKKASEEEAKKTESGAATAGSGPSRAPSEESRGRLHPVALHLGPSGDSTALGSLGTLCDPSSAISCTVSVILI